MEDTTIINVGKLTVLKGFNTYPLYNVVWRLNKDNTELLIQFHTPSKLISEDVYATGDIFKINLSITSLRNSCISFAEGLERFIRSHISRNINMFIDEDSEETEINVSLGNILINESSLICRPDNELWYRYIVTKKDVTLKYNAHMSNKSYNDLVKIITNVLANTKNFGNKYNLFHLEFDQKNVLPDYVDIVYNKTHILDRRLINYTKYRTNFYPSVSSISTPVITNKGVIQSMCWDDLIHYVVNALRTKLTTDNLKIHDIHSHLDSLRTILKTSCQCRNSGGASTSAIFDKVDIINELFQDVSA